MNKQTGTDKIVHIFLIPAAVYFLLDAPARLSSFLNLPGLVGPKNFLPVTFGLLAGPWSAAGMCLAAAASTLLTHGSPEEILAETAGILIMTVLPWHLWYRKADRPFCLKKLRDYRRFVLITMLLSVFAGIPAQILTGGHSWAETAVSYLLFTLLVGTPVLILTTSIFYIHPVCPEGREALPDISGVIMPDAKNIEEINEKIETLYITREMSPKQAFATQNCLEEFVLRIQKEAGNPPVEVQMIIRESVFMNISFTGTKFNPLRKRRNETDEDLFGLLLIRQHALRASYRFRGMTNILNIVI